MNELKAQSAVGSTRLVSRGQEIKQVEVAISKTVAAQIRAQETLDRLHDKWCRQTAESTISKDAVLNGQATGHANG